MSRARAQHQDKNALWGVSENHIHQSISKVEAEIIGGAVTARKRIREPHSSINLKNRGRNHWWCRNSAERVMIVAEEAVDV
jgi:hypothetical protein